MRHSDAETESRAYRVWHIPGLLLLFLSSVAPLLATDFRGVQFIGFEDFSGFEKSATNAAQECALTSPIVSPNISWNELIPSWNVSEITAALKIEVRGVYDETVTPFYTLGLWSVKTNLYPRKSIANQQDNWGCVRTDTLILNKPCKRLQIRLTFPQSNEVRGLKFFGLCLSDPAAKTVPLPSVRTAWGKLISVPERSQMPYPKGDELCSPATLSMLLGFYAQKLNRPELDKTVPEIQAAIYDETWKGTGNWPFNTAYAGSFSKLRACVARFTDLAELEDWVACGIPVGLSVCYNKLRGKAGEPSGHLVVCVGFTETGDPVINDPGTSRNVRKVFKRENLQSAWAHSRNTVYLVYPEDAPLPLDRFGHWFRSGASRGAEK